MAVIGGALGRIRLSGTGGRCEDGGNGKEKNRSNHRVQIHEAECGVKSFSTRNGPMPGLSDRGSGPMNLVLFCSAVPAEIDLLSEEAERMETREALYEAHAVGVGNLTAAFRADDLLRTGRFREIIFIGSAGAYTDADFPFFVTTSRFTKQEASVLEGKARIPDLLPSVIESKPGEAAAFLRSRLNFPTGVVNCPDSISLQNLRPPGIDYENMECFGVAFAARRHNIPFCAFLAVTNRVGPDGSREWSATYREKGAALQRQILSVLPLFSSEKS